MAASRVWHISEADTGLGLQLALKALSEGDRVIAAVKDPSMVPESFKVPAVQVVDFDMSWPQGEMNAHAMRVWLTRGPVDVLANMTDHECMGSIEETE